jgi:hypothetical protein
VALCFGEGLVLDVEIGCWCVKVVRPESFVPVCFGKVLFRQHFFGAVQVLGRRPMARVRRREERAVCSCFGSCGQPSRHVNAGRPMCLL